MVRFAVSAMWWMNKRGRQCQVIDGFYVSGRKPNWARQARYRAWKTHVQACAVLAGLELPLRATKEEPLYVVTCTYFHSGVHPDPENVHKSVVDSLAYVSPQEQKLGVRRGSDKFMGGQFQSPKYDAKEPRVEVVVCNGEEAFLNYVASLHWHDKALVAEE